MMLTTEYLQQRHKHWVELIAANGIWKAEKFKPIRFVVRRYSHLYDGMFRRKWVTKKGGRQLEDFLILYQQHPNLSSREIDDTLVHEMIHQYIFQNQLQDTSAHGKLFKEITHKINTAYPDELNITITGQYPQKKGPGLKTFKLIFLLKMNGYCYLCKVNPKKTDMFLRQIETRKIVWEVKDYLLCESNDLYFEALPACTKYLHGELVSLDRLKVLWKECNIKRI